MADHQEYTSLQELPFYNLTDRNFYVTLGIWSRVIDENIDLFNLLPNPDKFDNSDPDVILNPPESSYYSVSKINRKLAGRTGAHSLSIFHCNVRSLPKNQTLLYDLLYCLSDTPDVIGITETKLNENTVTDVEIRGYKLFHDDSPTTAGGAALYISESLAPTERPDIRFDLDLVESCWAEIAVSGKNKKNIILGCIYRHPNADLHSFTEQLENILIKLNDAKCDVYIMGDINIDFLKYTEHNPTEDYLDMLFSNSFMPLITKPTRITDHSRTLIDHIYTNADLRSVTAGIATLDISDHLPIFCNILTRIERHQESIFYRDYSHFENTLFLRDINDINWDNLISNSSDLHNATKIVTETIQEIVDKHAPIRRASQRKRKLALKPWITTGLLKSIKQKQKMYRSHYLSDDVDKVKKYKLYSNKLNHLKENAKR